MLEVEDTPHMEEMFKIGDKLKQKRKYTTKEIIKMGHELYDKDFDDLEIKRVEP